MYLSRGETSKSPFMKEARILLHNPFMFGGASQIGQFEKSNLDRSASQYPLCAASPFYGYRSDLKPARISSEKSFGCSQAAKCPPLGSLLKRMSLGYARSAQLLGAGKSSSGNTLTAVGTTTPLTPKNE